MTEKTTTKTERTSHCAVLALTWKTGAAELVQYLKGQKQHVLWDVAGSCVALLGPGGQLQPLKITTGGNLKSLRHISETERQRETETETQERD